MAPETAKAIVPMISRIKMKSLSDSLQPAEPADIVFQTVICTAVLPVLTEQTAAARQDPAG